VKRAAAFVLMGAIIALCGCAAKEPTSAAKAIATEMTTIGESAVKTTMEAKSEAPISTGVATSKALPRLLEVPIDIDPDATLSRDNDPGYSKRTDLSRRNLKATAEDDEAIYEIVRSIAPSFDPADYEAIKTTQNEEGTDFYVDYLLKIGEYVTFKGYGIGFQNNQATMINECMLAFSAPDPSSLSVVTDEIIRAAYQQAREKVSARNPNFVIVEQSGYPFYDLETKECLYIVNTTYSTDATGGAKGATSVRYKIP